MGYVVTTAPAAEPLTATEAKAHLKVDTSDDDTLITSLISAARIAVENYLTQKLVTQTITEYFDAFPANGIIELTFWPVALITHIKYYDSDGDLQTWDSANYQADIYGTFGQGPARIWTAYSVTYPTTRDMLNAVEVRYVAGYGAASAVPELIKSAIRLLLSDMYDERMNGKSNALNRWQHLLNVGDYKRVL